jgi:hypothetical protein
MTQCCVSPLVPLLVLAANLAGQTAALTVRFKGVVTAQSVDYSKRADKFLFIFEGERGGNIPAPKRSQLARSTYSRQILS